jgi:hypothetical protein
MRTGRIFTGNYLKEIMERKPSMSKVDYNDLLWDKLEDEFEEYRAALKSRPADTVIDSSYETAIRAEFLAMLKYTELSQKEAKALYFQHHPLEMLYEQWLRDEYSLWDTLLYTLEDTVVKAVNEMRFAKRERSSGQ